MKNLNKKKLIIPTSLKPVILYRINGVQEIEIKVKPGVKAEVLILNNFQKPRIESFLKINIKLYQNSKLNFVEGISGGQVIETRSVVKLLGSGAECQVTNMFQGNKNEQHVFQILIDHQSPNTKANVLVKAVYKNHASGKFQSLIKVGQKAKKTNSYYQDEVLLLDSAKAISSPTLEILTDDVKASHGSSVSRINRDQVYYLASRGLDFEQARECITAGFFTSVIARLPKAFCQPFLFKE
ncbi:MAG: SufD family Fe-S cluster assembly protein [Patescibacteria group bacterium]|jgi:Fe-S cluster assembly scaffold protein SufB